MRSVVETLPLHHFSRVVSLLARGAIVAIPTGTTYGLAVNATDPAALERLAALKGRPADKAFSVLLPSQHPERFVSWTTAERRALDHLRARPLTLLVKAKKALLPVAKDGRVGVRTADHPFTRELITLLPFPVTATSANRSGEAPACGPQDLGPLGRSERLVVIEGGVLPRGAPSTVARFVRGRVEILRQGEVTDKEIQAALATDGGRQ